MGSDIPHDIILDILPNLPVTSLLRFKSVSRQWFSSIMAPGFVDQHLSNQKKSSPRFLVNSTTNFKHTIQISKDIVLLGSIIVNGTPAGDKSVTFGYGWKAIPNLPADGYQMLHCDGILCFYGCFNIYLFNPSTNKSRTLPQGRLFSPQWSFTLSNPVPRRNGGWLVKHQQLGFGRDLVTRQYKIVKVFNPARYSLLRPDLCEIFTLDSDPGASWKLIGEVLYRVAFSATPVHVNGVIYWFTEVIYNPLVTDKTVIVMFDIHKEKFDAIPNPSCCRDPTTALLKLSRMQLGCLRGCLCLAQQETDSDQLNIWIMEDMTWKKMFGINLLLIDPLYGFRFAITERKDGTLVICGCGEKMYFYDPKCKKLTFWSYGRNWFVPTTFTESLVPLYSPGP